MGRAVPDVLVRALAELNVDVLVVEVVVLGEDVLLIVPLQRLSQLNVGDGVLLLGAGDVLDLPVEAGELVLDNPAVFVLQLAGGHQDGRGDVVGRPDEVEHPLPALRLGGSQKNKKFSKYSDQTRVQTGDTSFMRDS